MPEITMKQISDAAQQIVKRGDDWDHRFPDRSSPYDCISYFVATVVTLAIAKDGNRPTATAIAEELGRVRNRLSEVISIFQSVTPKP